MTRKKLGCSWVPEFIFHECCVFHDLEYKRIRNMISDGVITKKESKAARKITDLVYFKMMLQQVLDHGEHLLFYACIAHLYYRGVRIFGRFVI